MATPSRPLLEMALAGYAAQAAKIEAAMSAIRKELGVRGPRATNPTGAGEAKPKRVLSAAARKRIAEAQKERWAAFRARQAPPKRKLSRAARARLAAHLAKARAAKAAKAA